MKRPIRGVKLVNGFPSAYNDNRAINTHSCRLIVSDRDGHRVTQMTIYSKTFDDIERKADAELTRLTQVYPDHRIFREFI